MIVALLVASWWVAIGFGVAIGSTVASHGLPRKLDDQVEWSIVIAAGLAWPVVIVWYLRDGGDRWR